MIEAKATRYPKDFGPLAIEIHQLPGRYRRAILKDVVPPARKYARLLTSRYPGPVKRPFKFATDRSRRWFFANVPVPYIRTRQLAEAWDVDVVLEPDDGLSLSMVNESEYAEFVYGPRQVPGHAITGWHELSDTYDKVTGYIDGKSRLAWDKLSIRSVP